MTPPKPLPAEPPPALVRAAALWSAYRGVPFTAADVEAMTGLWRVAQSPETP
jgi:hypothetical protein